MKTTLAAILGTALVLAAATAPASAGGFRNHGFHGHKVKFVKAHGFRHFGHGYAHNCFFKKIRVHGHYGWTWTTVPTCR